MPFSFSSRVITLALIVFLGACHTPQPVKTEVGFKFIPPVPASPSDSKKTEPVQEEEPLYTATFVQAEPIKPLTDPLFPAELRGQFSGWITIGVRIVVDRDGHVTRTEDSLRSMTTPHRYTPVFRTAVETAVSTWRFKPAQALQLKANLEKDGSRWWSTVSRETVETSFDLAFTFSATGKVTSQ